VIYSWLYSQLFGRYISVGIATHYGLGGPGIESLWRPWSPPRHLYDWYRVFYGGKVAVARFWPPAPSSAEVKERMELYLYSTSGPSWPVLGWTLPLRFIQPAESIPYYIWSIFVTDYVSQISLLTFCFVGTCILVDTYQRFGACFCFLLQATLPN
jgi:hypothetical protein